MNHIVKLDCSLEGYVNIWLNKQQNKRVSGQIVESMHWIKKKNYICYCFKYLKLFYRFVSLFSYVCMWKSLSCVQLFATPWSVAC